MPKKTLADTLADTAGEIRSALCTLENLTNGYSDLTGLVFLDLTPFETITTRMLNALKTAKVAPGTHITLAPRATPKGTQISSLKTITTTVGRKGRKPGSKNKPKTQTIQTKTAIDETRPTINGRTVGEDQAELFPE